MKTTYRILTGWIAVALLGSTAFAQQGSSGSIFPGFSSGPAAAPSDPFAARGAQAAPAPAPNNNGATRLPPTGATQQASDDRYANSPQQMNVNGNTFNVPSYDPARNNGAAISGVQNAGANPAHGPGLLRDARLALAVTDVNRARSLVAQARQEQAHYASNEDNPDRVDAAINKFADINRLDKNVEENRRAYARMLMEQAEDLLQWNELEQADKLASLAADQRVTFSPFDQKPDVLQRRIAALKMRNHPDSPMPVVGRVAAPSSVGASQAGRSQAANLMRQIRMALNANQIGQAEFLCRQLDAMRIPETAFAQGDDTPGRVFEAVHAAQRNFGSGVAGNGVVQAGGSVNLSAGVQSAVYDPSHDPTRNMQVAGSEQAPDTVPAPPSQPAPSPGADGQSPGYGLFQQAEAALKAHDTERALQLLRQASAYSNELDQQTAARLQDQLSLLSGSRMGAPRAGQPGQPGQPVDETIAARNAINQAYEDVNHRAAEAKAMREKDPKMSLTMLEETKKRVETSSLDPSNRDQLLRRLDRDISDTKQYIEANRSTIELNAKNDKVREDIRREAMTKEQMQQKLAELVDQFNHLNQEQRYEEAEVVAKKANELAPRELVTTLMLTESKIRLHDYHDKQIRDQNADHWADEMIRVSRADDPGTGETVEFPKAENWKQLTINRSKAALLRSHNHRSAQEMEIEKKLQTPVNYSCHNRPLNEVLGQLAKLVNINIHIDEEGLKEEGRSPDLPVTLETSTDIMLKSYLETLLGQYHLCYVIKNEMLNVTSESKKGDGSQIYQQVYPVGDLVMPIPNFVASPRMGLAGAYHDAMSSAVGGNAGLASVNAPMQVMANARQGSGSISAAAGMANMMAGAPMGRNQASAGPGGAGGGVNPDFDTLIDLLTQTVSPQTWDHNGGKGTVAASPTNLSLVISQTQEVHEEIVDLLEQLRRMQDLQVTIEVRFITLNDNFFERIGVDFDFTIAKNIANPQQAGFTPLQQVTSGANTFTTASFIPQGSTGTAISGIQAAGANPAQGGIFTADNSIQFTQGSYALGVPQFGGFDATAGATVGFAILNDIEAFFFINAAAGDKRTNVLQAPKVTLFNGQQAFVSDTSQTPFVISVIPVVGDFAAAQQPVIVVLSEGTFMTVQAVVSNDRRFVRLTVVPFFSKIGNVQTFTFQGSSSTTQQTTRNGLVNQATGLFTNNTDNTTTNNTGVTVQLPTFSFVTVTTTVSVPDGGTVLLGGIKRLSEGRNEFGVPILDEIPYLNRLFKNVGIGRETSSLLMMVTPRIIIQEEEEDKLGIGTGGT